MSKHTPGPWNLGKPERKGEDAHVCVVMTQYWLALRLRRALATLRHYREEQARCRAIGRRFGGGDRYVQDARRNLRGEVLAAVGAIRDFARRARELGYRPREILLELDGGRKNSA